MNHKKGIITGITVLLTITIIVIFFYFNGKVKDVPDVTQSVADIITTIALIYGFISVNSWKKEKENELLHAKCNELHGALCSFSVFIQLTTNLVFGKDALYRIQNEEDDELARTQLNIEIYQETYIQTMSLMCKLQLYFHLRGNVREEYRAQMAYLIIAYTSFCKRLYQPIGKDSVNRLISMTQDKLKTPEYANCMTAIIGAKIEDLFDLDK